MVEEGLGRRMEVTWVSFRTYTRSCHRILFLSYPSSCMSHCGYHSVDTIDAMKTTLQKLRDQLSSDTDYFRHVYNYTFEFSRPPGQRSLGKQFHFQCGPSALLRTLLTLSATGLDMAQGFWAILIPHGLQGGALAHVTSASQDDDGDDSMDGSGGPEEGWKDEYTQWWFEFLEQNGMKGVSKDVWQMVCARPRACVPARADDC